METDEPNEPVTSPTNHVVPVRTPEHGIKPMDGEVTSVPATDAMLIHEAAKKGFQLREAIINERERVEETADDLTWNVLVNFGICAKEITDLLAKVNKQSI